MSRDKEHIIDYILSSTDIKKASNTWKKQKKSESYESRKIKLDNMIYYCKECLRTWSTVPYWINTRRWTKYPKNHIPIIGKKIKNCPQCKPVSLLDSVKGGKK